MPKKGNSLLAVDTHVGQRVKTRRLELGMSQTKLADSLGVSFQQIQKYENGRNRMGSSRLKLIADALKVSPSYFFDGLPEHGAVGFSARSPAYINKFVASHDGMALIAALLKISRREVRRRIVELVESLAGSET